MARKSELEERVIYLEGEVDLLEGENRKLRSEVARTDAGNHLAALALEELDSAEMAGAIGEDATTMAKVAVITTERSRLTEALSAQLVEDRYEEFAADVRASQGPEIMARLRELFASDGTFEKLRVKAEDGVKAELQAGVLEEEYEKAVAELQTPEALARLRDEIKEDLRGKDVAVEQRARVRAEKEEEWAAELEAEILAEIDEEEAAREEEFKTTKKEEIKNGERAVRYRQSTRAELEEKWAETAADEVAGEIDDEVLRELLEEKAALLKEQLEKEIKATKLLIAFEGGGVNVAELPANTGVDIYLGEIGQFDVKEYYKDNWGNRQSRTVKKPGVACKRKLTLRATEESGFFIVDDDTLLEATSEYERDHALRRGTIITIGRRTSKNGEEKLEPRITADIPLYLDDDTTEPHITDAKYPVANVVVDGVSAREVNHVEMV